MVVGRVSGELSQPICPDSFEHQARCLPSWSSASQAQRYTLTTLSVACGRPRAAGGLQGGALQGRLIIGFAAIQESRRAYGCRPGRMGVTTITPTARILPVRVPSNDGVQRHRHWRDGRRPRAGVAWNFRCRRRTRCWLSLAWCDGPHARGAEPAPRRDSHLPSLLWPPGRW